MLTIEAPRRRVALVSTLVATLLPAVVSAQPDVDQVHYRWRHDDGNETAATFAASEDTTLANLTKNAVRRLRFEVANQGTLATPATSYELQFAEAAVCTSAGPAPGAKTIDAGEAHTCALLSNGEIHCWGRDAEGELGDGTISGTPRNTAAPVVGLSNPSPPTHVAVGGYHSCAGFPDGSIECWGSNWSGELGDNTTMTRATPAPVMNISTAVQVQAGYNSTCARLASGAAQCWGDDGFGQLGNDGAFADSLLPVNVLGLTDVTTISPKDYHACALRATGQVTCFGNNSAGQVGDGNEPTNAPVPALTGVSNVVELSTGGYHTCVRYAAGNVQCWGRNDEGQLGDGNAPTGGSTPVNVVGLSDVVEIAAGGFHTCARHASGSVSCWGANWGGQLGDGSTTDSPTPVTVNTITNAVALTAGEHHTCAVLATGDIACWGEGGSGQLGGGTSSDQTSPFIWTPAAPALGALTYTTVPTDTSADWQIVDSSYYNDGDPTTDVASALTNEATSFVAGELKDAGNPTGNITLAADAFTEIEFALRATGNATDGANYCFRLYDGTGGQSLDFYTVYAQAQVTGTTHYRSIGTAPDYTTGTITATDGSATVTGTGTAWRAANRGRGDRIDINGTDYTVRWVNSDTELILTDTVSGNYSGAYTISRQFDNLLQWEDCIDGPGGLACTYFPVTSNNLVNDNRREVGIAYNDSVFVNRLVVDGSITGPSHDITLTVDPGNRHVGVAGTGVVLDTGVGSVDMIQVLDDHVTIEWLELTGGGGTNEDGVYVNNLGFSNRIVLRNLLIHDVTEDGILIDDADTVAEIYNNFVYNAGQDAFDQNVPLTSDSVLVANNTFFGNTSHAVQTPATGGCVTLVNNIGHGNTGTDFDVPGAVCAASGNNLAEDATALGIGTGGFQASAAQVAFASTSGVIDLHLQSTSTALEQGADLSATFLSDIDGEMRPAGALWDVGADERQAAAACTTTAPWYDLSWASRKEIVIDSGAITAPLSGYPVLINLATDTELANEALDPNGDDILFTAGDGVTKLSHEIELFNGTTGQLTAWVKVPYISSGADTSIFMYYGNGSAVNQEDVVNVWDSNFKGIWHLDENPDDPSPQFPDVTANTNDGTANSLTVVNQVPGRIDGSLDFDGTNERHVNVPDDPSLKLASNMTVSAWVQTTDTDPFATVIVNKWLDGGSKNYWLGKFDGTNMAFQVHNDTYFAPAPIGLVADGMWHHLVGVADASAGELRIYVDGIERGSDPTYPGTSETGTSPLQIGKSSDVITQVWLGRIDEVRVSDAVRSDAWIQAEFANQNDPSSFYTLCSATTDVELRSFTAHAEDAAVELRWETASELDNLGFHVYRSTSRDGLYAPVTERVIPGLGSSPSGAKYTYHDVGLTNGVTYYYKLEDIETTGKTTLHGPVSATPSNSPPDETVPNDDGDGGGDGGDDDDNPTSLVTYGTPTSQSLRVRGERGGQGLILELETDGFFARPQEDGTVLLEIPGFDATTVVGKPAMPVRRSWVEAIAGRRVEIVSVESFDVEPFTSLVPTDAEATDVVASPWATIRAVRSKNRGRSLHKHDSDALYPSEAARIAEVGFQGETKKALVELAPLRWDAANGRLLLARRLVVELAFRGRERGERALGGSRGRRFRGRHHDPSRETMVRLVTTTAGLHAVRYEDVVAVSARLRGRASALSLSRQGNPVPFHLEPSGRGFGPGSVLYFVGAGGAGNPYGNEAIYQLEWGVEGVSMPVVDASPRGHAAPADHYWRRFGREENTLYQPTLLDAEAQNLWLWDLLFAPVTKSYPFELTATSPSPEGAKLSVWLRGGSTYPAAPDHHVRVFLNGTYVAEASWDGKAERRLDVALAPGLVRDGVNTLDVENVGDTEAPYSLVFLDRFELTYPRFPIAERGTLEGQWTSDGIAEIAALASDANVLDVTEATPRWLAGVLQATDGTLSFRNEAGHRYLAVSSEAVLTPRVLPVPPDDLKSTSQSAEYLVIAPRAFLPALTPLLDLRRDQGLSVEAVSVEAIYSSFGYGEATPEAIRSFLTHAYHEWQPPSLRYVVLVGDASYDFKDYLSTGAPNGVPPWMLRTSYLWTASDPTYAAVNGDDLLPDVAVGRLPAGSSEEARAMVAKIVAYESRGQRVNGKSFLIADNGDRAGAFEQDANELASGILAGANPTKIYVSSLGPANAREAIRGAFDGGASLMSYLGHGGIHVWADENLLDITDVARLSPQAEQPILITMNCLNGYFHFPYFDSLSEELVKAEDRGAIAAFSPSGLSVNGPAHRYHQALLAELTSGRHRRLGDAILAAQAAYADAGALPELLSIYHLLGDPALNLDPR